MAKMKDFEAYLKGQRVATATAGGRAVLNGEL